MRPLKNCSGDFLDETRLVLLVILSSIDQAAKTPMNVFAIGRCWMILPSGNSRVLWE